jgi:hypothetical protein
LLENGILDNLGDKIADENELHQLANQRNKIDRRYRGLPPPASEIINQINEEMATADVKDRKFEAVRSHKLPLLRQQLRKNALGIIHGRQTPDVPEKDYSLKPGDKNYLSVKSLKPTSS